MNTYNKIIVCFVFFFIFSCTQTEKNNTPFTDSSAPQVSSNVVYEDFHLPMRALVNGNRLFVTDCSNEPAVHVFTISDEDGNLRPEAELGREGRSWGEFLAPDKLTADDAGNVFAHDAGVRKLVRISEELEPDSYEYFFRTTGMPLDIHWINQGTFLVTGILMDARFQIFNAVENELREGKNMALWKIWAISLMNGIRLLPGTPIQQFPGSGKRWRFSL